jgi:hypothetical protein
MNEITNFIRSHAGCSVEHCFEGVDKHMARNTFFNDLAELKSDNVVIVKRVNKRDQKLTLNRDNLLVSIPKELDEFEKVFTDFLKWLAPETTESLGTGYRKAEPHVRDNNKYNQQSPPGSDLMDDPDYHTEVEFRVMETSRLAKAMQLLNEVIRVYSILSVIDWPRKISDKQLLSKLLTMVFSKISNLQLNLVERIGPEFRSYFDLSKTEIETLTNSSSLDLEDISEFYSYFDLDEKVQPLLNYIQKIRGDPKKTHKDRFSAIGVPNPFNLDTHSLKEFFDPELYFEEKLGDEYEIQVREVLDNKSGDSNQI